jgi:hypothetical protein
MKHNFEERKQNRIDYAGTQAQKNEEKADAFHDRANTIASYIPMGQPILVGHHSEKRHRNDLKKIHGAMNNAREARDKAAYYASRVKAMEENTAISSDDPEAIQKLQTRLETLTSLQTFMKAANRCIKKQDKDGFLKLPYGTDDLWAKLNEKDFCGRIGFPDYKLTNNNANMRRIKQRIQQLEAFAGRTTKETTIKGVRLVENVEANRVQLIFPDKPDEKIREELHAAGFNWCRSEGAWQRFLTNSGIYAARQFLERL